MNDTATQWCLVFERALSGVFCIGPFPSEDSAATYAKKHHQFPQVWRVAELKMPQESSP